MQKELLTLTPFLDVLPATGGVILIFLVGLMPKSADGTIMSTFTRTMLYIYKISVSDHMGNVTF